LPKGEGLGIAAHRSFPTYVATVVHAGRCQRQPRVHTATDCGFHINQKRIRPQIEGSRTIAAALL
jgi:isoquinoline 1-oxidoreductase beta subunit